MENTDEKYMREALREAALAAEDGEVPVGAVIVCNGRIIGRGHNMTERLGDPTCASALGWAHVSEVVYGADDPKRGYSLFSPSLLHPRTKVRKGIMSEECGNLMSGFFKDKRK